MTFAIREERKQFLETEMFKAFIKFVFERTDSLEQALETSLFTIAMVVSCEHEPDWTKDSNNDPLIAFFSKLSDDQAEEFGQFVYENRKPLTEQSARVCGPIIKQMVADAVAT